LNIHYLLISLQHNSVLLFSYTTHGKEQTYMLHYPQQNYTKNECSHIRFVLARFEVLAAMLLMMHILCDVTVFYSVSSLLHFKGLETTCTRTHRHAKVNVHLQILWLSCSIKPYFHTEYTRNHYHNCILFRGGDVFNPLLKSNMFISKEQIDV